MALKKYNFTGLELIEVPICVRLETTQLAKLEKICEIEGLPRSHFIRKFIDEGISIYETRRKITSV
jgi:hypothetical protein